MEFVPTEAFVLGRDIIEGLQFDHDIYFLLHWLIWAVHCRLKMQPV